MERKCIFRVYNKKILSFFLLKYHQASHTTVLRFVPSSNVYAVCSHQTLWWRPITQGGLCMPPCEVADMGPQRCVAVPWHTLWRLPIFKVEAHANNKAYYQRCTYYDISFLISNCITYMILNVHMGPTVGNMSFSTILEQHIVLWF